MIKFHFNTINFIFLYLFIIHANLNFNILIPNFHFLNFQINFKYFLIFLKL